MCVSALILCLIWACLLTVSLMFFTQHVCVCVLILYQIWAYFLTVSLVFFVTLACFPAIVSLIRSVDYRPGDPWTGE